MSRAAKTAPEHGRRGRSHSPKDKSTLAAENGGGREQDMEQKPFEESLREACASGTSSFWSFDARIHASNTEQGT